jgi:hypothetical protein
MNESNDRKDQRRQKFLNKNSNFKNQDFVEEQKFVSKSKKERKKKIEDIRGDELWEDWQDWENK